MQSRRDAGITALVLGFFASAWFGWGQAAPPAGLGTWLTVGSVLALVVAAVGASVGFRSPASTAALHDRAAGRRYGVIVGIENRTGRRRCRHPRRHRSGCLHPSLGLRGCRGSPVAAGAAAARPAPGRS